jgi:hypothetical protein
MDPSTRQMHRYQRSRPGIQRSDHTSASVRIELDDSRHSLVTMSAAPIHFPNLIRKESVQSKNNRICGDSTPSCSKSLDVVPPRTSFNRDITILPRLTKKKIVRFAPSSEILYIPIPSMVDISFKQAAATWYSSKDYDEQRISNRSIVYLIEQELQQPTTTTIISAIQRVEGARGLEQRTIDGAQICYNNRQQSIQAVLREQERLNRERTFLIEYKEWNTMKEIEFEERIAAAYGAPSALAKQEAIDRAIHDANVVTAIQDGLKNGLMHVAAVSVEPSTNRQFLRDKRFYSSPIILNDAPINVSRDTFRNDAKLKTMCDSLHTLSSTQPTRRQVECKTKRSSDRPVPPLRDTTKKGPSIPNLVLESFSSHTS